MGNKNFFKDLPYLHNFEDITDKRLYREVPADWFVLVADIMDSTTHIELGKFREVNFVGTCALTAVINAAEKIQIPFVFGGDGGILLIPPDLLEKTKDVLRDTKFFALKEFGMHLRIAAIPVIDILRNRYQIRLVKLKVGPSYFQPVFDGGGLDHADYLAKSNKDYLIHGKASKYKADFSGLECIWKDLPAKSDEVVNLLVKATSLNNDHPEVYKKVIQEIGRIYGTKENRFPVYAKSINYGISLRKFRMEAIVNSYQNNKGKSRSYIEVVFKYFLKSLKRLMLNLNAIFHGNLHTPQMAPFIDSEKFDDMLRMVITGTKEQRYKLVGFLEEQASKKNLAYGIHTTKRAYMTCLIFERPGRQIHFIDGSNGGYAIAAKELKNRIKWQKAYY